MADRIEDVRIALRAAYARKRGGCSERLPVCMGMAARGQCTCDPLPSDRWKKFVGILLDEVDELRALATEKDAKLGKAVRRSISGMDPESRADRLDALATDHGPDRWEHDILRAIARVLREEGGT